MNKVSRADVVRLSNNMSNDLMSGLPTFSHYLEAVETLLATLIPGDIAAWNNVDVARGRARVRSSREVPTQAVDGLAEVGRRNPMVGSYLGDESSDDVSPRRITDLMSTRQFVQTETYSELYKPLGSKYQLTILTARSPAGTGRCWAINRSVNDFADDEVELAQMLQPALIMLERAFAPATTIPEHPVAQPTRLTVRETQILARVAEGLTAHEISRHVAISPRTVHKHLENIYSKLGVSDRLQAVLEAQRLSLIPPSTR